MSLELWNKFSRPPKTALKQIQAGRLRGKSDINPQFRYQVMTEVFGVCGVGWKYTIDRLWLEPGNGVEVFAFAQVSLYVKLNDVWSYAIPGVGGRKLVVQESNGIHNDDEAYKGAITDALSVAMKMIGVAAEIYLGNWDGSKYRDQLADQPPPNTGKAGFAPPPTQPKKPPFSWSNSDSAGRTAYVLNAISQAKSHSDPVQGMAKLKEISSKLASKGGDFTFADMGAIQHALLSAEQDINAECAASGQ